MYETSETSHEINKTLSKYSRLYLQQIMLQEFYRRTTYYMSSQAQHKLHFQNIDIFSNKLRFNLPLDLYYCSRELKRKVHNIE